MRISMFCCVLLSYCLGLTGALAAPPGAVTAAPIVQASDPVITLDGFCRDPGAAGEACKTIITRADFEKLVDALQPDLPPSQRLAVANAYARNLRMAAAAERRQLDQTAQFQEALRFARLQLLAQDLTRVLQLEADKLTEAELRAYYDQNQGSFERANLARIFVPHARHTGAALAGDDGVAEMAGLAAVLRARAAGGEDPHALQIEAYAAAGTPHTEVNTRLDEVRRNSLPPAHEAVMDLRPGEVSAVISDPAGAHFIYKMLDRRTSAFDEVQVEIRSLLSKARYRESMKAFEGNAVFSDAYFLPLSAAPAPAPRGRRDKRSPATDHSGTGQPAN